MYTAMLTVENIHGAHHDIWSVNVEEEYHEVDDSRTSGSGDRTGADGGARGARDGGGATGRTGRDAPILPSRTRTVGEVAS
jgi:hypothetical protein